jgi:hypothetical protein
MKYMFTFKQSYFFIIAVILTTDATPSINKLLFTQFIIKDYFMYRFLRRETFLSFIYIAKYLIIFMKE